MIRKLMASSAILALMTAGTFSVAQAQTDATQNQNPAVVQQESQAPAADQQDMAADSAASTEEGKLQPDEPTLATAFIGRSVFSSEDPESDNIGEVNDLIISDDGTITHAVVGVGGFLGIGEKDVAVPFEEFEVVERDGDIRLVYAATREQLEAAEEFDRTAYDPSARFAEEQAAMQPATDTAPAGSMAPAGGGIAPAPAGDMAAAPSDTTAPGDLPAPADTAAETTDAAGDTVSTAEESEAAGKNEALVAAPEAEQSGVPAEDSAEATAAAPAEQETAAATADQAEQDVAAATEQPADTAEEATAEQPTDTAQADQPADATQTAEAGGDSESQFLSFSADQVRASTLLGKEIFGPDDQSIGEVSDLVLQKDGETRAALIDVGGFLGVGEKEIAIPFDQIEVQQAQDQGGEPRLTIAMSREELEQLPAFEDNTMGSEETAATEQPADQGMTADQPADQAAAPEQPADQTATADATQQPADQDMAADQAAQPADQAADAGEQAPPPEEVIAGAEAQQLETQGLSAGDLIGSAVYGPDDQTVGEVGDVIFGEEGEIEAVVIDVGGFLGIGEKPVAVQFDALNVQKDQNGGMTLSMDATQEQLENAPAYNEMAENQQQPVQ
jgi:sporulation protein YlmC with PRC-barrel domain